MNYALELRARFRTRPYVPNKIINKAVGIFNINPAPAGPILISNMIFDILLSLISLPKNKNVNQLLLHYITFSTFKYIVISSKRIPTKSIHSR